QNKLFSTDPLVNPEAQARYNYYDRLLYKLGLTQRYAPPAALCSGKKTAVRASTSDLKDLATDLSDRFRVQIDPLLEEAEAADLSAEVKRDGNRLTIQANVKGLKDPGPGKKLRFLLVEEAVRYRGENS